MKILSNKKYNELILKSCKGMFGAVTDDMLLRDNALLIDENKQLKEVIDKAIEYIQNHQPVFQLNTKKQLEEMYYEFYKNILEILGDKENE